MPVPASSGFSRLRLIRWGLWLLLLAVTLAGHWTSLRLPFVFDDGLAVLENPSLLALGDLPQVLSPPANGSGASGRPLVNLSLAINFALGGYSPVGYHLFNVLAHGLTACLLAALLLRCICAKAGPAAVDRWFWTVTLGVVWWALHPLQTECLGSVIQRTEILVGHFYVLTLYAGVRVAEAGTSGLWSGVATASCLAGVASKEIMVTAPLMVLLTDRALFGGTFAEALRRRRLLYLGLASGWVLLGWLVFSLGGTRGAAAGFGTGVITWWSYFLKQWEALVHYLRLVAWPHPLIADYGTDVVTDVTSVLGRGLFLSVLAVLTLVGAIQNRLWALPAVAFFFLLGPSSSVMPLPAQTMAEHRMYLPLACVGGLAAFALHRVLGRRLLAAGLILAPALVLIGFARYRDYSSEARLWWTTIHQRPGNERAHYNLGRQFLEQGRLELAMPCFRRAIELEPRYAAPRVGLGNGFIRLGQPAEAVQAFEGALALDPKGIEATTNLGAALCMVGRTQEGMETLRRAVALDPKLANAHFNLGTALLQAGRLPEAVASLEEAVRLRMDHAQARNNLGVALLALGRRAEAEVQFRAALTLLPNYEDARVNLARSLPR